METSKEKQMIEEIALDICKSRGVTSGEVCEKCYQDAVCLYQHIAMSLYGAGYRKQNEELLLINEVKSNNSEVMSNNEIEEMAEMLEIIARARELYANDVTDRTENEYIREGLLDAGYRKQSVGEWIDKPTGAYGRMQSWCSACGKHSGIGGIESNRHKPFCPNCGAKMKCE